MIAWRVRNSNGEQVAKYKAQGARVMKDRDIMRLWNPDKNNANNTHTVAYIALDKYILERVDQQSVE